MAGAIPSKLKEPYPADFSMACILKHAMISSAFVFIFMWLLQPFGFTTIAAHLRRILFIGYAVICFASIVLNHLLWPRLAGGWFREEKWTSGREMLWAFWITLTIAIACYLFTRGVFRRAGWPFREDLLLIWVFTGVFFIGAILITIITIVQQNLLLRRSERTVIAANAHIQKQADIIEAAPNAGDWVSLVAENEKDLLRLPLADLIYIAAQENYVDIHFKKERIQHQLLRSSLTRVEEQVREFYPRLFRCHRAFIVNVGKIVRVSGNAQGLRLSLRDVAATVPVARRYVDAFRRIMEKF